ncbi:type IV pilus biogenesis protein PilP [uncultured Desulfovibrio sp.]|uniref:type IV pilus biogenesis protein PilP n=1 Tax=uncultured Desulfovibrio sp. TaxID=167968 RepID=UPI002621CC7B|nr:type IV pilus biogenesis protein PilP [uncultured Desulfovibrio sp.]
MHAKKLSKKQAALIVGGFSALCVAGVAGWFFMNQKDAPAPRPRPAMTKKVPAAGTAPGVATLGTRRADAEKKADPLAKPPTLPAPAASDTTLGDLSRLRGVKRVLQQEAEIADLRRRLAEAQQPIVATPVPQPQPAPQATIKLPPLDDAEKEKPKRRSGPSVVSVQGVDGRLSADIRTSDGRVVTVKNGERFNGGVLVVSRKGVSVRKSGALTRIPFEQE